MQRIIVVILLIAGMITFLNCEKVINNQKKNSDDQEKRATIPEWYPSTISNYEPYEMRPDLELNPGQTEFTEAEIISYAGQFIDQRKDFIGADLKSLTLVEVKNTRNNPQGWSLSYEQTYGYGFKIVNYGTVGLYTLNGKVMVLRSRVLPVVPVPDEPIISDEEIRESLIGETLIYYSKIESYLEYKVKGDETITFRNFVVFPTVSDNMLEIRLCRELELKASGVVKYPRWSLFYDVITGELIYVAYQLLH